MSTAIVKIFRDEKIPESHLFALEKMVQHCYDFVGEKVFAVERILPRSA